MNILHPCNYQLEAYSVGALLPAEMEALQEHVAGCAACRAYLEQLEGERVELECVLPAGQFMQQLAAETEKPSIINAPFGQKYSNWFEMLLGAWRKKWMVISLPATAVVLGMLAFLLLRPAPDSVPERLRTMGGFSAKAYLKHESQVTPIVDAATIHAGDAVQFTLSIPRNGYLTVFFMDEQGNTSWLIPPDASGTPLKVPSGEFKVPHSAAFDDSQATERSFVFYSPKAFVPAEMARLVQKRWRAADKVKFAEDDWVPALPGLVSIVYFKH